MKQETMLSPPHGEMQLSLFGCSSPDLTPASAISAQEMGSTVGVAHPLVENLPWVAWGKDV